MAEQWVGNETDSKATLESGIKGPIVGWQGKSRGLVWWPCVYDPYSSPNTTASARRPKEPTVQQSLPAGASGTLQKRLLHQKSASPEPSWPKKAKQAASPASKRKMSERAGSTGVWRNQIPGSLLTSGRTWKWVGKTEGWNRERGCFTLSICTPRQDQGYFNDHVIYYKLEIYNYSFTYMWKKCIPGRELL